MRSRPIAVGLAAIVALLVASSVGVRTATPRLNLASSSGSWTEYHRDDAHTGFDGSIGTATGALPGWTSGTLDGSVYASPLIFNGVVYAATLQNTIYALRQADGVAMWHKNVGAPQTSGWTCGNISPTGILGTPIIDTAANRIYVVAELAGATPTYHLFGLDLGNSGNVVLDTPIAPTGFDWHIEQERGALALHNGFVYVPFGGRAGDCGSYHGYVIGVPTSGSTTLNVYQTPSVGSGLWAAGGLVVDDATGNVFGTTGNAVGSGCSSVDQNDAVLRLSPTLALQDWFMPNDWQANWCSNDQDLGSAGPLLIGSNLLFQSGKWGGGFLLNPNALGGVDGQLFPTPKPQTYSQAEVCFGNHSDATFGSFAYAAPFVYVECDGHGLVALNVNTGNNTFSPCDVNCTAPDWQAGSGLTFGPPIVAGGLVWAASSGNGLYAFDAATGAQVFHSGALSFNRFVTPAEAGGSVYVPANNIIQSFDMSFLPWTSLKGVLISGPDAASWSSTRADVFAVGQDHGLWQDTWNGTAWAGWGPLGGVITSDPGAVSWGVNRIDVIGRGSDGALYHRSSDGTSWSAWDRLAGGLTFGPDLASWGAGRLDLFITGLDHALWHTYWTGSGWAGWERLGGYLTSSPAAVSWSANRIDIFARGVDNQMWHMDWANGWGGWEPVGGLFSSGPDAASCASNRLDVFAVGLDGGIWRQSWTNTGWSGWGPLGSQWTSDPSAVCLPGTTTVDLFERGSDGAIFTASVTGS
jgi:hypothetical protein